MTSHPTNPHPLEGTSFRTQLEAAQRVVMTAHRCTEDQAFDELLDVATRHHLDFAHFIDEFTAIDDRAASLTPVDDHPSSARAIAQQHWQLLTWPRRQHQGRTAS